MNHAYGRQEKELSGEVVWTYFTRYKNKSSMDISQLRPDKLIAYTLVIAMQNIQSTLRILC